MAGNEDGSSMQGVGMDTVLTHEGVLQFRDGVIWPAVNHLANRDVVAEAMPGEDYRWRRTLFTPQGLLRCTLAVECIALTIDEDCCEGDEEYGDEFEIAAAAAVDHDATVTIEKLRPDMLEPMMSIVLQPTGEEEIDEDAESLFKAWQSDSYRFSSFDGCPIDVKNDKYLLEDESGSEFWSTDEMAGRQEEGAKLSQDDLQVLTEMKAQGDISLTIAACKEITDALHALGVPLGRLALDLAALPKQH